MNINTVEVHSNVIRNTLSLSKRMNAQLEVLHVLTPQSTDSASDLVQQPLQESLSHCATTYTRVIAWDSVEDEVAGHIENRRDLLCIVLDISSCREAGKSGIFSISPAR